MYREPAKPTTPGPCLPPLSGCNPVPRRSPGHGQPTPPRSPACHLSERCCCVVSQGWEEGVKGHEAQTSSRTSSRAVDRGSRDGERGTGNAVSSKVAARRRARGEKEQSGGRFINDTHVQPMCCTLETDKIKKFLKRGFKSYRPGTGEAVPRLPRHVPGWPSAETSHRPAPWHDLVRLPRAPPGEQGSAASDDREDTFREL